MTEQPFLKLLSKLMPPDLQDIDGAETILDKKFDKIIGMIEEEISPQIMSSNCVNKLEIVRKLRQLPEYYRILCKLPELMGRRLTLRYSKTCYFNAAQLNIYAAHIKTYCINALGERVTITGHDLKLISELKGYTVPVKAFINARPNNDPNEVLVFAPSTAEYYDALKYFDGRSIDNINLRLEMESILQQVYQYFENYVIYLENKLSILNRSRTLSDDKKLMSDAHTEIITEREEAINCLSILKGSFENLSVEIKEVREDLLRLSEGRIPEYTSEQVLAIPHYKFSLEDFGHSSKEDVEVIKNPDLRKKILANLGDIGAVREIALEKSRDCMNDRRKNSKEVLELWNYISVHSALNGEDLEWVGLLYQAAGNKSEAIRCFKKADTGYANYRLGVSLANESATLEDLRKVASYYQVAQKKGYIVPYHDTEYIQTEIEAMKRKKENTYKESVDYSTKKSSVSSSSDGCFVTTAVCKYLGKSDNCYELSTFRNVRDNWLTNRPEGNAIIKEYYEIAPRIVRTIDSLHNAKVIYATIWNKYLKPCLDFIECGDNQSCVDKYIKMIIELNYLYGGN